MIEIAAAGLAARDEVNSMGDNEVGFLNPLREIIASGQTPAERLLDLYNDEWAQDLGHIYQAKQF